MEPEVIMLSETNQKTLYDFTHVFYIFLKLRAVLLEVLFNLSVLKYYNVGIRFLLILLFRASQMIGVSLQKDNICFQ